jgi:hypothetical protein
MKVIANACTKVVADCVRSWNFMYSTMQTFKAIHELRRLAKADKNANPNTAQSDELIGKLKTAAAIEKTGIRFNMGIGRLCEAFMSFRSNDDVEGSYCCF